MLGGRFRTRSGVGSTVNEIDLSPASDSDDLCWRCLSTFSSPLLSAKGPTEEVAFFAAAAASKLKPTGDNDSASVTVIGSSRVSLLEKERILPDP